MATIYDEMAPGTVDVQVNGGWLLVQIGRERRIKRFNLTRAEAVTLVAVLREELPELK